MSSVFSRLAERKLVSWTLGYLAGAWAVLQALAFGADTFEWSDALVRGATIFLVAGLVPVVVLGWYRTEETAPSARRFRRVLTGTALVLPALLTSGWYATRTGVPDSSRLDGEFAFNKIAVLYFHDRGAGELKYLTDGITEGLIDELSAVSGVKVISRGGVAPFKGRTVTPDSVARTLSVGTLVTGSVALIDGGERLRIDVQFIDALSGAQLDRTRLEMPRANVVDVQDSVVQEVSAFLRKRVGQQMMTLSSRPGTRSDKAWAALQQARQALPEVDTLLRAGEFSAALARRAAADSQFAAVEKLDSKWVRPMLERGWLDFKTVRRLPASDPQFVPLLEKGLAHAERALALEPQNFDALELRATLHYWQWLNNLAADPEAAAKLFADAEKDFVAATADPRPRASAWNSYSHLLINKGEVAQAKIAAEHAYNADPWLTDVDRTLFRIHATALDLGIKDEAERWCNVARTRFPNDVRSVECRMLDMALPGARPDIVEAWVLSQELVRRSSPADLEFNKLKGPMNVALALARAGLADSAVAVANRSMGDASIDSRADLIKYAALVHALAGRKDSAIELLARYYAVNPHLRGGSGENETWWTRDLIKDPRYQQLIRAR